MYNELEELAQYKAEADINLEESRDRINQLASEVRQLRGFVEEQKETERGHLLKVREMEGNIIQITENLEQANKKVRESRELWKMVSECSTKAIATLQ